jgi:hypothetical protein
MPSLQDVWNHLQRRYPDKREVTVDELVASLRAENYLVERWEIVGLFQEWAAQKLGSFTVGRRTRKSRIWLYKTPREQPTAPQTRPATAPAVEYTWPLSTGRSATLKFPADLSPSDVERINEFLKSYVAGTESQLSASA